MNEPIEEALTKQITGAAIEVHGYWGLSLVERLGEKSLAVELEKRSISTTIETGVELQGACFG